MLRMYNFLYRIEPLYRFTKLYQLEQKHVHNGVLKIADEILEDKLESRQKVEDNNNECIDHTEDGSKRNPKSFIQTLVDPKNEFSYQEMKDEINTMIAAVSKSWLIASLV
jgi:hypothetical protein